MNNKRKMKKKKRLFSPEVYFPPFSAGIYDSLPHIYFPLGKCTVENQVTAKVSMPLTLPSTQWNLEGE
jgi:hypothetical protein